MRRRQVFAAQGGAATPRPVAQQPEKTPAERYFDKYGKPPHHRMKPETILERLQDGNASDGGA